MAPLTSTISEDLKAFPDAIFEAQTLPNATELLSTEFNFGEVQGAVELVVRAVTAISIADGQTLRLAIHSAPTSGGSFVEDAIFFLGEPSGGTLDFEAGDIIATIVSNRVISSFNKLAITTSANESAETVDAYMRQVSR